MSNFFRKHADKITEDMSQRPVSREVTPYDGRTRLDKACRIDLNRIEADIQHREHFSEESLAHLAQSLKEHGQLQPIRVRWCELRKKYIIVAGERRYRAAALAGLPDIECVVADADISESEILREQVIENLLREGLLPSESARAFQDLMDKLSFNGKELAAYLHVAPSTVSRTLAVLELPAELRQLVDTGECSIKDAIAKSKGLSKGKANGEGLRKRKPSKDWKIVVGGYTVSVKARRILSDDLVLEALEQAKLALIPVGQQAQHEAA